MGGRRAIVPVVALLLAAGACGTSDDGAKVGLGGDAKEESQGTSTTTTTAPLFTADPPLAFDVSDEVVLPDTAKQSNLAGDVISTFMSLRGDTAYISEPTGMRAIDVHDGEDEWFAPVEGEVSAPDANAGPFVNSAGPRPPAVSEDGKTAVMALAVTVPGKGTTPDHQAVSVLAVDTDEGEVAWSATVDVPEEVAGYAPDQTVTRVVAVTDEAVVVTYRNESAMTVVIDPATQEVRWQRDRFEAATVVDGMAVGAESEDTGLFGAQQVLAVGLTSGDDAWSIAAGSPAVTVVPGPEDPVVVQYTDDEGNPHLAFLDPDTGQERAGHTMDLSTIMDTDYGECTYDEQSVVLCDKAGVLNAFDAKTGKFLWSLPDDTANRVAPRVTTLWHGAVYGTTENGPVVLDAETGEDRSTEPGLAPWWVNEQVGIGLNDSGTAVAYRVKEP